MAYLGRRGATAALTTGDIPDNSITAAKIVVDTIAAGDIAPNAITPSELADNAVTTSKIVADAVDGTKLADNAVNSEHYTDGSIDLAHMSVNSIDSDQYVDASIDTAHIGDDQVTADKLANSINTDIATGVTANTTANAALPKAGGTITGTVTVGANAVGTMTTDNDGSFAMSASNNFKCTPAGNFALTFTAIVAQSGNILLINSGGHTISAHANTKVDANLLATISTAGTYLLAYFSDGTNVYMTNSAAYA